MRSHKIGNEDGSTLAMVLLIGGLVGLLLLGVMNSSDRFMSSDRTSRLRARAQDATDAIGAALAGRLACSEQINQAAPHFIKMAEPANLNFEVSQLRMPSSGADLTSSIIEFDVFKLRSARFHRFEEVMPGTLYTAELLLIMAAAGASEVSSRRPIKLLVNTQPDGLGSAQITGCQGMPFANATDLIDELARACAINGFKSDANTNACHPPVAYGLSMCAGTGISGFSPSGVAACNQ